MGAPEPPQGDQPQATSDALADGTPDADLAPQPPHINVDAFQGTATQLADLMGDDAESLSDDAESLSDDSQPVDAPEEDPEPPTVLRANTSPALRPSSPTLPWRR